MSLSDISRPPTTAVSIGNVFRIFFILLLDDDNDNNKTLDCRLFSFAVGQRDKYIWIAHQHHHDRHLYNSICVSYTDSYDMCILLFYWILFNITLDVLNFLQFPSVRPSYTCEEECIIELSYRNSVKYPE